MEKFEITLRYSSNLSDAEALAQLLEDNEIACQISKNTGDLDAMIVGEMLTNKYEIQIQEKDHQKAERVLAQLAQQQLSAIEKDHYLYSFSDEELVDVLIKADEWSEIDVALSEQILKKREVTIDYTYIEAEQERHRSELAKPEGKQDGWILVGYVAAIIGGFFGLLIGYALWTAKKRLPDGTKVQAYNDGVQRHGRTIFFISLVMFILVWGYKAITWLELQ